MDVAETLDAAADYIEKNGWCQHMFVAGERTCVLGAIVRTRDLPIAAPERLGTGTAIAIAPVTDALRRAVGDGVWEWNDAPGRTAAEVIAMLRAAACTERAREIRVEVALAHERVSA